MLPAHKHFLIHDERKLKVFDGDIEAPNLGLSAAALAEIKSTATIYIHAASSINLHRSLSSISTSVLTPTLEIASLALSSPLSPKFVYISTAYANAHL